MAVRPFWESVRESLTCVVPAGHQPGFARAVAFSNWQRTVVLSAVVAVTNLLLGLVSSWLIYRHAQGNLHVIYAIQIGWHVFTIGFGALVWWWAQRMRPVDESAAGPPQQRVTLVFSSVMLFAMAFFSVMKHGVGSDATMYLIGVAAVGTLFYLPSRLCGWLFGLSLVGFGTALVLVHGSSLITWMHIGQAVVAISIFWAGSRLIYCLKARNYLQLATIARQAEELVAQGGALRSQNAELARLHQLDLDAQAALRLAEEKARLELLRYQLNPHFLFNTLTSICAQLPPDSTEARATIERLTEFCRLTLSGPKDQQPTILRDELAILRAYLDIEQTRWRDLLTVEIDIPEELGSMRLPPLLLLPLVENALKYGRGTSSGPVTIRIAAKVETPGPAAASVAPETLMLEVANTGRWVPPESRRSVPSLGIGLENLRQRLGRYYPGHHELTTTECDGWVRVRLRLDQVATAGTAAPGGTVAGAANG